MYQSYRQQADPSRHIQPAQAHPSCTRHIGRQDHDRRNKLQKRPVYPRCGFDKFIHQDHHRVKHSRAQPVQDPQKVPAALRLPAHADDQDQSCRGHGKTEDLLPGKLLMEQKRAYRGYDDRSKIVAQGRR